MGERGLVPGVQRITLLDGPLIADRRLQNKKLWFKINKALAALAADIPVFNVHEHIGPCLQVGH